MKLELDNWSEAETDLLLAKEVLSMLSESLHHEGHKHESDVAYAVQRLIESGLNWIECGLVRGDCDGSPDQTERDHV